MADSSSGEELSTADVNQWLCSVLNTDTLPVHENDSFSTHLLQRLAQHCTRTDAQTRAHTETIGEKCGEFAAERVRLHSLHRRLHVSPEQLDQDSRRRLQLLGQLGTYLQLSRLTPASVFSHLLRWRLHTDQLSDRLSREQQMLSHPLSQRLVQLAAASNSAESRLLAAQQKVASTREPLSAKRREEIRFLGDKTRQYERQCAKLKRQADSHTTTTGGGGRVPSHQAVCGQLRQVSELEQKLQQVEEQLKPLGDLPISPRRAAVRVAALQNELEELEQELSSKAGSLATL